MSWGQAWRKHAACGGYDRATLIEKKAAASKTLHSGNITGRISKLYKVKKYSYYGISQRETYLLVTEAQSMKLDDNAADAL